MVPEAWMQLNLESTDGSMYHLVTGFACGKWRDAMAARFGDDDAACCRALDVQLRRVFSATSSDPSASPYAGGMVFDWTRDVPFVQCAYSAPLLTLDDNGVEIAHFPALAAPEPHLGRYWAGEHAAYPRAAMTAHAALYSGMFSSAQVLSHLKTSPTNAKL